MGLLPLTKILHQLLTNRHSHCRQGLHVLSMPIQVAAVGRRLAELVELLGAGRGDIDVVWMVLREPRLLTADLSQLRAMLLKMKIADGCEVRRMALYCFRSFRMVTTTSRLPPHRPYQGVDVAKICEAQPALLLQNAEDMDVQAGSISSRSPRRIVPLGDDVSDPHDVFENGCTGVLCTEDAGLAPRLCH